MPALGFVGALLVAKGTYVAIGYGLMVAGGLYQAQQARQAQKAAKLAAQRALDAARGLLLNETGTVNPIPVLYGARKIGGSRVFVGASGDNNMYLHIVLVHCEGEVYLPVSEVYADDVPYRDARYFAQDNSTGGAPTYLIDWWFKTGTDAQTAESNLVSAFPGVWDSDCKLSGLCYSHFRLRWHDEKMRAVPNFTILTMGRRIYDPRTGVMAVQGLRSNPALCIRDYLRSARFGANISDTDLHHQSFVDAANYCDEIVSSPPGMTGTNVRYTLNGVCDPDQKVMDNLEQMLATCRGSLVFTGGKYRLLLDRPAVASFTFTESNIVGAWQIQLPSKRSRYNRAKIAFPEAAHGWQTSTLVLDFPTYRAEDGGEVLEMALDLPMVTERYKAQRLGEMAVNQSRLSTLVSFRATIAGLLCEVGDVVNITHSMPGWVDKPFRVLRMALLSSDEVEVTAQEYSDAVYVPGAGIGEASIPQISLPNPLTVPAPTGLTLTSGPSVAIQSADGVVVPRILAQFIAPTDAFRIWFEVEWKRAADSAWQRVQIGRDETATYLSPAQSGQTYDVRVRARTGVAASAWATGSTLVVAPESLPTNVQDLSSTGTWTKPAVGRIAVVELWGGGGGGGAGYHAGAGGGGGLYVSKTYLLADLPATVSVNIGAGGAGADYPTGGPGMGGGNSTFGALLTAHGGQGGAYAGNSSGSATIGINSNPGGPGGGGVNYGAGVEYQSLAGKNTGGDGGHVLLGAIVPAKSQPNGGGGGLAGAGLGAYGGQGGDSQHGGAGGGGAYMDGYQSYYGGTSRQGGNGGTGSYDPLLSADPDYVNGLPKGGGGGGGWRASAGDGGAGWCKVTVW